MDPLGNQFAKLTVNLQGELFECAALAIEREVAGAEIRILLDDRGIVLLHDAPPWVGGRLSSFDGLSLPAVYSLPTNLSCRNSVLNGSECPLTSHSILLDARQSLSVSSKSPNSELNF